MSCRPNWDTDDCQNIWPTFLEYFLGKGEKAECPIVPIGTLMIAKIFGQHF